MLPYPKFAILLFSGLTFSGSQAQNGIAEKLGYPKDSKLLIIHADDLGVSHSENDASIKAMERGSVNSASIMVPCPWFPEIAAYARKYGSKQDLGLHLTLTSEWTYYKWGPVSPVDAVQSLVNSDGYFYANVDSLVANARPEEVETELRNQVKKALAAGIDVTHLDAHMYAARSTEDFLKAYIKTGREFQLPVLLSRDEEFMNTVTLKNNDVVVDHLFQAFPEDYDTGMDYYYKTLLQHLEPGLNCLLVHTAFDDAETRAMTIGHTYWGARWRQQDYDFFTSEECRELLKENNIRLITWRELRDGIVRQ